MNNGVLGVENSSFWDEKAPDYPIPGEDESQERNNTILDIIAAKGISFEKLKVLDIGCGTGGFSIPLAERGACITALDFSHGMLSKLAQEAKRRNLHHMQYLHCSWKDIDPGAVGLERGFDMVLSAFSQAVETEDELRKMERCSRKWCAYIATGKIDRDAALEHLLRKVGVPLNARPDIRNTLSILENLDRGYQFEFVTFTMNEPKTPIILADEIALRLEASGKRPDRKLIADSIAELPSMHFDADNNIVFRRQAVIGTLLWRIDQPGRNSRSCKKE